jgi:hypothetical protein
MITVHCEEETKMKCRFLVALAALAVLGCEKKPPFYEENVKEKRHVWDRAFQMQAHNAVNAEMCVYPDHFMPTQPKLSSLGRKHLQMMVTDLVEAGGPVFVAGNPKDELVNKRVKVVEKYLLTLGLKPGSFTVVCGPGRSKGQIQEESVGQYDIATEPGGTPDLPTADGLETTAVFGQ